MDTLEGDMLVTREYSSVLHFWPFMSSLMFRGGWWLFTLIYAIVALRIVKS